MFRISIALFLILILPACVQDETISGKTAPTDVWRLAAIGTAPVDAGITIRFPEQGRVAGDGPCNSYTAAQTAPLPWIDIGPVIATRRACAELTQEVRYFALLGRMAFVEVLGDTILMTAEDGTALTFRRADAA